MPRANIWDGSEWVSMTGGVGEGDTTPDDTYLRIDSANNPAAPANYLRQLDGDLLYLPLTGGTLTGGLQINGGMNLTGNITIGDAGVESFRYLRNFRGVLGEYAQFWAGAGGGGPDTPGAIVRYHDGTVVAGDYYHGSQEPGGRGFHNPPAAGTPDGFVWQSFYVDAARRTAWRRVTGSRQEIAVLNNVGAQIGALMFDHLTGDLMAGATPRTGSQLRNFSHSSTDAPPSGSQPGDIFLVYT